MEAVPKHDLTAYAMPVPLEKLAMLVPPSGCPSAPHCVYQGLVRIAIEQKTQPTRRYCIANQTLYLPYSIFWLFPLRVKEKSIDCRTHTEETMEDDS